MGRRGEPSGSIPSFACVSCLDRLGQPARKSGEVEANLVEARLFHLRHGIRQSAFRFGGGVAGGGEMLAEGFRGELLPRLEVGNLRLEIVGHSCHEAGDGWGGAVLELLSRDRLEDQLRLAPDVLQLDAVELTGIVADEGSNQLHLVLAACDVPSVGHQSPIVEPLPATREAGEEGGSVDGALLRQGIRLGTGRRVLQNGGGFRLGRGGADGSRLVGDRLASGGSGLLAGLRVVNDRRGDDGLGRFVGGGEKRERDVERIDHDDLPLACLGDHRR